MCFPRVGVAYQPGVRNAAQFHEEDAFLPFRSHFGFRRRLVGRGTEMPVSFAAEAALAQREPGADFRQIRYFSSSMPSPSRSSQVASAMEDALLR